MLGNKEGSREEAEISKRRGNRRDFMWELGVGGDGNMESGGRGMMGEGIERRLERGAFQGEVEA